MVLNSFMNVHVPVMMSLLLVQTPDRQSKAGQPWQRAVHMIQWPSRRSPWEMPHPWHQGHVLNGKLSILQPHRHS